ncbi:MAG: DUF1385 domain-containing protein [Oscillospiraceae bacterium]|jgi:uncharacterized protein YqhQ
MKQESKSSFKTRVGGQALIEGVMMRGIDKAAMAVLLPDKSIDVETWKVKAPKKRSLFFRFPFVRGVVNLIESLIMGYKCLMKSAEKSGMAEEDEEQGESRFEQFLLKHFGEMAMNRLFRVTTAVASVIGVLLAIGLFIYLPALIARFLGGLMQAGYLQGVIEGMLKIVIFVLYLFLISRMKEIRRVFEFHGAEHKTIACYEAGEELTPENAKKFRRFHPRCGTSFLLIVLILGIIVFSVVSWDNLLIRTVLKIALLPVVVGVAYEIIRLAGRYDNIVTRIVSAPGMWLQRITTNEPDEEQLVVAIAAIKPVLPENREEGRW